MTVPDRRAATLVRATIGAAIPIDGKSGVHLALPAPPRPGSKLRSGYRLRGRVVVEGLSHADTAALVEAALRGPSGLDCRREAARGGTVELAIWLRSPQPIWDLQAVCASWPDGSEVTPRPHDVHFEGSKRYRSPRNLVGHTLVHLAVRADDETEARQRVAQALEAADVGFLAFTSVITRHLDT